MMDNAKQKKKKFLGIAVEIPSESKGFPHVCKKCGHEECDLTDLGPQLSDEASIYLYKCRKCGHVERQSDGTGNV